MSAAKALRMQPCTQIKPTGAAVAAKRSTHQQDENAVFANKATPQSTELPDAATEQGIPGLCAASTAQTLLLQTSSQAQPKTIAIDVQPLPESSRPRNYLPASTVPRQGIQPSISNQLCSDPSRQLPSAHTSQEQAPPLLDASAQATQGLGTAMLLDDPTQTLYIGVTPVCTDRTCLGCTQAESPSTASSHACRQVLRAAVRDSPPCIVPDVSFCCC